MERQEREQTKERLRVAAEAELVQRRLAGLGQGAEGGASGSGGNGSAAAGVAAMQTEQVAAAAGGEGAAAAAAAGGGSADAREASPGGSGTQQAVAPAAPSPAPAAGAAAGAAAAGQEGKPGPNGTPGGAAAEAAGGSGQAAAAAGEAGGKAAAEKQREEDARHKQYKAAFEALPLPLLRTLPQVGAVGEVVGEGCVSGYRPPARACVHACAGLQPLLLHAARCRCAPTAHPHILSAATNC